MLGDCYARAIQDQSISFDMLFGPAYKGIGLVHCAAISLSQLFNRLNNCDSEIAAQCTSPIPLYAGPKSISNEID